MTVVWDGKTDAGARAPDGLYRLQLGLRRTGRTVTIAGSFVVDTTAPTPVVLSVDAADRRARSPAASRSAPAASAAAARRASASCAPTSTRSRRSRASRAARAAGAASGTGRVDGAPAPPGTYMVVVRVRDRSGNVGTAPAVLPPVPGQVRGKPGITVRQITAQPPVEPVRAGERVQFFVDSRRRPYRWTVRRVGASRPIKKGRGAPGKTLSMRAPRGISGAYLLQIRSGRYQRPRAVPRPGAGAREAARRDARRCRGWASTRSTTTATGCRTRSRPAARSKWPRVINGAQGVPPAFAAETAPLLVFLDRARIRYDLTSDIALARSRDPRATDREGVVLAGSLRWVPRPLARRLRRYVEDGGRLASFGTESLRRGVRIGAAPAHAADPADADRPVRRAARARREPAHRGRRPHAAAAHRARRGPGARPADRLRRRASPAFGRLEESLARPETRRAKVLTALGQDVTDSERAKAEAEGELPREALPVLTATRLGKGVEIRVGLTQWAQRAGTDAEVAQITRNIADILRRVRPRVPLGGPLTIPSSAIRSGATASSSSGVSVSAARSDAAASSSASSSSSSGRPYQSSARGWRASSAPARKNWNGCRIATAAGVPGSFMRLAWPIAARAATVGTMRASGSRDGSTATTPGARSSSRTGCSRWKRSSGRGSSRTRSGWSTASGRYSVRARG